MQLTTFTDYSLRVLMYAGLHSDRLVTISEMAAAYGISANHLMKVVHHLARHGHLQTVRGKGGGIRLTRPPESINLGALVRETEVNDALVECFSPATNRCRLTPVCRLKGVLHEAREAFYDTLGRYTLADLLVRPRQLADALAVPVRAETVG